MPTFDEWATYLRVDAYDADMKWLVQVLGRSEWIGARSSPDQGAGGGRHGGG